MAVSLPDELLHEILFRLKDVPADLFRCAAACKGWRGLVAEPAFLRRCWPDQDASSFLVGFFTGELGDSPCFIPTPRSALGPGRRALSSFVPGAILLDHAVPLASRHGLLLVRLLTTHWRDGVYLLAVCNLLTGACRMLPPLSIKSGFVFNDLHWKGYAILIDMDCRSMNEPARHRPSTSSFFKVVIVTSYSDGTSYRLRTFSFSSDEAAWEIRAGCSVGTSHPDDSWSPSGAVVRRGTVHWLFRLHAENRLHVVNLDTRTGHTSLTKFPLPMNRHRDGDLCLALAASGALSLLWLRRGGTQLVIWEQKEGPRSSADGGSSEWIRARVIELKQPKKVYAGLELGVAGVKCGTLLVHDSDHSVYTADLETGVMEEVMDLPFGWNDTIDIHIEIVPVEVDWLTFFASRLGTMTSCTSS